jgi:lipopolysaccharide/colanic/teichoic acid biosynthesis glycosyltransferase
MSLARERGPTNAAVDRATGSVRRLLDLLIASTGLVLMAPIMVLVALGIWIESGRPIIFSQIRVGQLGRHFRIHKFRKFYEESGAAGCGVTIQNDGRLTRLGSILETTKIDELPQLWNIIKGDMSTVGPRPESLSFADCFTRCHLRVLEYKPGIFGPTQFYFRDEGSLYPDASDPERFYREVLFPLKASIDLAYFPNRTIRSDIGWIVRGVLVVFGLRPLPTKFNALLAGWLDQQDHQQPHTELRVDRDHEKATARIEE